MNKKMMMTLAAVAMIALVAFGIMNQGQDVNAETMMSDMATAVENTAEEAQEMASDAVEATEEMAADAMEAAEDMAAEAETMIDEAIEPAAGKMEEMQEPSAQ